MKKDEKRYSAEEILKAGEIGEVSMIDVRHVVSLLDEAKKIIKKEHFDCYNCKHSFSNPFDTYYCLKKGNNGEEYDLEKGENCGGKFYKYKH